MLFLGEIPRIKEGNHLELAERDEIAELPD